MSGTTDITSQVFSQENKRQKKIIISKQEQQRLIDRRFMGDEAKRLDSMFEEVGTISALVAMNLVATRQKLQPFVSEGVVYKDRKKR